MVALQALSLMKSSSAFCKHNRNWWKVTWDLRNSKMDLYRQSGNDSQWQTDQKTDRVAMTVSDKLIKRQTEWQWQSMTNWAKDRQSGNDSQWQTHQKTDFFFFFFPCRMEAGLVQECSGLPQGFHRAVQLLLEGRWARPQFPPQPLEDLAVLQNVLGCLWQTKTVPG